MDISEVMDLEPSWLEAPAGGFPSGGVGERMQEHVRTSVDGLNLRVVAEAGRLPLTSVHTDSMIAFAEFLAGSAFRPDERSYLHQVVHADFVTDPAASLEALQQIVVAVAQIPTMDPETRATHRLRALATSKYAELGAGARTPVIEVVERYNPVLAVDVEAMRLLTADAAEAFTELHLVFGAIAGVDGGAPSTDELLARYGEAPPVVRAELAAARQRWVAFRANLRSMGEHDWARFGDMVRARVSSPDDVFAAVAGIGFSSGILTDSLRLAGVYESRRSSGAANSQLPVVGNQPDPRPAEGDSSGL